MIPKKKNRWNYLIYPKFQLTLILLNNLIIIGILMPIFVATAYSFAKLKRMGINAGLQQQHVYFKFLNLQKHLIESTFGIAVICGILVSTGIAIFISHRVAGPIVRLKEYFGALADHSEDSPEAHRQSLKPIHFRKGDFFDELPNEINRALEKIQSQNKK
jgi:hypothetical protein